MPSVTSPPPGRLNSATCRGRSERHGKASPFTLGIACAIKLPTPSAGSRTLHFIVALIITVSSFYKDSSKSMKGLFDAVVAPCATIKSTSSARAFIRLLRVSSFRHGSTLAKHWPLHCIALVHVETLAAKSWRMHFSSQDNC